MRKPRKINPPLTHPLLPNGDIWHRHIHPDGFVSSMILGSDKCFWRLRQARLVPGRRGWVEAVYSREGVKFPKYAVPPKGKKRGAF